MRAALVRPLGSTYRTAPAAFSESLMGILCAVLALRVTSPSALGSMPLA
jgi:hypothetical protein